jgi:hypothetical protein
LASIYLKEENVSAEFCDFILWKSNY